MYHRVEAWPIGEHGTPVWYADGWYEHWLANVAGMLVVIKCDFVPEGAD